VFNQPGKSMKYPPFCAPARLGDVPRWCAPKDHYGRKVQSRKGWVESACHAR